MDYVVNLNKFQGPFDLLFHLIEENEIDIYDIPISEITQQYIGYLDQMVDYNMDVTSEFILMASSLIEIKSKMLLPNFNNQDEEDPRDDLVSKLIEYKLFKEVSEEFKEREIEELRFIPKPKEEIEYDKTLNEQVLFEEINVYDLLNSINSLLKRRKIEINREVPSFKLRQDDYSVNKCIKIVKKILKEKNKVNLIDVFKMDFNKGFIIAIFLSILELSRDKSIKILQDNLFGEIYLLSA